MSSKERNQEVLRKAVIDEKVFQIGGGILRISPGYLKFDQTTVYLTVKEYLFLEKLFISDPYGSTINQIYQHLGMEDSVKSRPIVNTHSYTARKKLMSLTAGKVSTEYRESTKTYHILCR